MLDVLLWVPGDDRCDGAYGFDDSVLAADVLGEGDLDTVDVRYDVSLTLADLAAYDAVYWMSACSGFATLPQRAAMGDLLADYVDGGGAVVLGALAAENDDDDYRLRGRLVTGGYVPYVHGPYAGRQDLADTDCTSLWLGVEDLGSGLTVGARPAAGATVRGTLSEGDPAVLQDACVYAVNLWPGDDRVYAANTGDTVPLLSNVLAEAAAGCAPEPGVDSCQLQQACQGPCVYHRPGGDLVDTECDGWLDADDVCPALEDPDQADRDGDRVGDACDGCPDDPFDDADGDGLCGDVDNCPFVANRRQVDTGGGIHGDACEPCQAACGYHLGGARVPDTDCDGWLDADDPCPDDFDPTNACGSP